MPVTEELISALRCPVTGQSLKLVSSSDLDTEKFPEGALVTEDGSHAYPIEDGFPILLKSEVVEMT